MRYYNYLNERRVVVPSLKHFDPRTITRMERDEVYEWLSTSDIFKLYQKNTNNILYRGVKRDIYHYSIEKRRKDRKPKDMPSELHRWFDNEFQKQFGWKARSEGVFVIANERTAQGYGRPYIFIPKGKYRFLYSKEIKDLWAEATGDDNIYIDPVEVAVLNDDSDTLDMFIDEYGYGSPPSVHQVLDKIVNSYTNKNIQLGMEYKHEIMFDCDEYFLFEKSVFEQILKDFK